MFTLKFFLWLLFGSNQLFNQPFCMGGNQLMRSTVSIFPFERWKIIASVYFSVQEQYFLRGLNNLHLCSHLHKHNHYHHILKIYATKRLVRMRLNPLQTLSFQLSRIFSLSFLNRFPFLKVGFMVYLVDCGHFLAYNSCNLYSILNGL